MPFAMVNSGSTYNRMVRKLLGGSKDLESYVDDVLGHTGDWNEHMKVLRDFFERIRKANLSLKPSKYKNWLCSGRFSWAYPSKDTIRPQRETVGRILDTDRPKTKESM